MAVPFPELTRQQQEREKGCEKELSAGFSRFCRKTGGRAKLIFHCKYGQVMDANDHSESFVKLTLSSNISRTNIFYPLARNNRRVLSSCLSRSPGGVGGVNLSTLAHSIIRAI